MNKELESILKVKNKGWMIELFETNISDALLCEHCKSVSCKSVELGCDHADNDIYLYCYGCLIELIVQNDGKCPLNSHSAPIISPNRVSRRQISKAVVYCPYSKAYKQKMISINGQIINTLGNDEKEGLDVAAKSEMMHMKGCEYKSNLNDLINNHLPECIKKYNLSYIQTVNINILKNENKHLTEIITDKQQQIQQLSLEVNELQNNLTSTTEIMKQTQLQNKKLHDLNKDWNKIANKEEKQIKQQHELIKQLWEDLIKQQAANQTMMQKFKLNTETCITKLKQDYDKIINDRQQQILEQLSQIFELKYMFNYKDEENDEKQILPEKWDENLKGPNFKIKWNMIQKVSRGYDTAFMNVVARNGVHDWYIKIENYFDPFTIGIFNTKFDETKMFNTYNYEPWPYSTYLWNLYSHIKCLRDKWGVENNGKNSFAIAYGQKPDVNDIIHIHLDLNKLELSFGVNGNEFGKCWDVEKGGYRVVIRISSKYMRLRLTKYKHTQ